jgi:hypothetical protein
MKTFILIFALAITASAQTGPTFVEANAHQHQHLTTIEGTWVSREVVDIPGGGSQFMLGNMFTIKSGDRLVQFYRWFKADDAPFLATILYTSLPVRVTYDPECGYAVAIEIIQPSPTKPAYVPLPARKISKDWRVTVDYFPLSVERRRKQEQE